MVRAGKYRHRITIQPATATTSTVGQTEYTYPVGTQETTWARVEQATERKGPDGEVQASGSEVYVIYLRNRSGMDYRSRIQIANGETLQVVGISVDVLGVEMTVEAEKADL